jgi:hypothetical protein
MGSPATAAPFSLRGERQRSTALVDRKSTIPDAKAGDRSGWSNAGIAKMMFKATFAASVLAASLLAAAAPAAA